MGKRAGDRFRFLLQYTGLFAALALVVFSPFIIGERSFVWKIDGLTQHVKALSYYGMYLRGIIGLVVSGQGFQAPTFSFGLGYGQDVLDTLNYYAIGDPLNLLAVCVPAESTPVLYTALVIVRLYLAGLAFTLYAGYAFDPPRPGLLVGSLTFAFCGFALFACVRHPYFINPLVYFPLVLYGVEKALRERKHIAFSLSIALSAVSNFYFFYMIFLLMALYIVMRLVRIHRGEGLRAGLRRAAADLGRLVASGAIGVLVSCVVFVPVVMFFMQDSRQAVESIVPLVYPWRYYSTLLLNVSTTSDPGYWSFLSIGIVGIVALFAVFSERGDGQLKLCLCLMAVMLCVPFAGHVLNGFSYVANRWSWAFCLAGACAVSAKWTSLTSMSKRRAASMLVAVAVYLAAAAAASWAAMPPAGLLAAVASWALSALAIAFAAVRNHEVRSEGSAAFARAVICAVACAGVALNGLAIYSPFGGDYASRFVKWSEAREIYRTEATAVAELDDADDGFHRYSAARSLISRNAGMLSGVSSTASYWSLADSHAKGFFTQMGINGSDSGGCCWYDLNGQSTLNELLGVSRFMVAPGGLRPYGYAGSPSSAGSYYDPRSGKAKDYELFDNAGSLPFGFTYGQAISPDDFTALEPRERREAVLQSCVVGDCSDPGASALPAGVEVANAADSCVFESQSVPYELEVGGGVAQRGSSFAVEEKGATVSLNVSPVPNAEPSVQFTDLTPEFSVDSLEITADFRFADGTSRECVVSVATPESNTYEPYHWITVGPGYSSAALESVVLEFPAAGTYSFTGLEVIAQRMGAFDAQVSALTEDVMENVDLHYLNDETAATNLITGDVSLERPKVLCTQIPYADGWRVYVDGQEADVLQLNVMLAGVELDAGSHHVEFAYETPGLLPGALLSLLGIVLLALMAAAERRAMRFAARG